MPPHAPSALARQPFLSRLDSPCRVPSGSHAQSPRTQSTSAFTLIELLVTIACMMVAATIFLPILAKSKARSSKVGCNNNLKQIGLAFRTFAIDNNDHYLVDFNNGDVGLTVRLPVGVTNRLAVP